MSKCLVKLPHEDCGSSDGLQVFSEGSKVSGYCFACATYVPDPLGDGVGLKERPDLVKPKKTEEELLAEMKEIENLPCMDIPSRRLRKDALEEFGVRIGVSEYDGKTPTYMHFPYTKNGKIVRWKTRLLQTKQMWSIGTEKEVDLFGWEQAKESGAKRLIIVEGELDAPSLLKCLKIQTPDKYQSYIPAVVSITNGASGAAKEIGRLLPEIRKHFREISLCFDDDDAGRKATEEVCKICPEATVITLPRKDANECLMAGLSKAVHKAVSFNTEKKKNTRLVCGQDIHEAAKVKAEYGLSYPWKGLTELTRGVRFGETIYIAAAEKLGKSEVVNALGAHFIKEHGLKILMAKPEEANNKTYKLVAGKMVGKVFHDPKIPFDEAKYEEAGELIGDNLYMLNLYQNITWDGLRDDIYEAHRLGCKVVFIDPVTNLTNGQNSSEINQFLQGFSQEIAAMAKDLDIVVFLFCHLNKPPKGTTPFDRGGKVSTEYFAGSSGMARSCNYAMALQGNKDPDLPEEERNMREIVVLADREFGEVGGVKLYWDRNTGLFNEA